MDKIVSYIVRAQGIGAKFLLLMSLVLALFVAVLLKTYGTKLVPFAQGVAEEILPIKVENGVVVEPADTFREIVLFGSEDNPKNNVVFVFNTSVDSLEVQDLKQGIYLTRTRIYTITDNQVRFANLEEDFHLPQGDYTGAFRKIVLWTAILSIPIIFVASFVGYLIVCLLYSLIAWILCAIFKKEFGFDFRMRLSVLAFITTYVVFIPLELMGISSKLLFFVMVVGLQTLVVSAAPAPTEKK